MNGSADNQHDIGGTPGIAAAKGLSPREVEVLTWVAAGKSSTVIGTLLGISARTVNFHVENAVRKLGAANRSQAVVFAAQQGVIPIQKPEQQENSLSPLPE